GRGSRGQRPVAARTGGRTDRPGGAVPSRGKRAWRARRAHARAAPQPAGLNPARACCAPKHYVRESYAARATRSGIMDRPPRRFANIAACSIFAMPDMPKTKRPAPRKSAKPAAEADHEGLAQNLVDLALEITEGEDLDPSTRAAREQ